MLRTGSIRSEATFADGLRISVMSRHTLKDGNSLDPEIIEGTSYVQHWPELAPSPKMVGGWYRGEKTWQEFEDAYLKKLRSDDTKIKLAELAGLASRGTVTVLCVEETPHQCHRRILAEEVERRFPGIETIIR